jgi:hypothetical protein
MSAYRQNENAAQVLRAAETFRARYPSHQLMPAVERMSKLAATERPEGDP